MVSILLFINDLKNNIWNVWNNTLFTFVKIIMVVRRIERKEKERKRRNIMARTRRFLTISNFAYGIFKSHLLESNFFYATITELSYIMKIYSFRILWFKYKKGSKEGLFFFVGWLCVNSWKICKSIERNILREKQKKIWEKSYIVLWRFCDLSWMK